MYVLSNPQNHCIEINLAIYIICFYVQMLLRWFLFIHSFILRTVMNYWFLEVNNQAECSNLCMLARANYRNHILIQQLTCTVHTHTHTHTHLHTPPMTDASSFRTTSISSVQMWKYLALSVSHHSKCYCISN